MEEANNRIECWIKEGDNSKILDLSYLGLTEVPESIYI